MALLPRLLLIFFLVSTFSAYADEDDDTEAEGIPEMNAQQRNSRGIMTSTVGQRTLFDEIVLPGEVTTNAYRTSLVTSRISAQVVQRFVKMGDSVQAGQRLVTLSSVAMADAQGQLLIANREWERVQELGRKIVSEQRFIEAQVKYQQGIARLLAYGMTAAQVNALVNKGDASNATGEFDVLSLQAGTVLYDQFLVGEIVEPGQKLMEISDESLLWVEAQISPDARQSITVGTPAQISTGNHFQLEGKVVQIHRLVDETTRTLPIRIEAPNQQGQLYPGQFARVALRTETSREVLAVPKTSVTLLHGEQVVFILKEDQLSPQLVETSDVRDDWIEISGGLSAGDEIVTRGVFLLKSMLLKSQIGDAD